MAAKMVLSIIALLALPVAGMADALAVQGANPIRKVVTLLQNIERKVSEEGVKEKELYDKFMCHCKSNLGELKTSIAAATAKAGSLPGDIKAAEEQKVQLEGEIVQAKADRVAAEKAIQDAQAVRAKEAAAFAKSFKEMDQTKTSLDKAVVALSKGTAASFLQSDVAQQLKAVAVDQDGLDEADRQEVLSFLASGADSDYAPQSGEIMGILKTLAEQTQTDIDTATKAEQAAIDAFKSLTEAKTKEAAALTSAVESKTQRVGELGVSIVQMKEELSTIAGTIEEDKKFLADLEASCSKKTAEWEERVKTRNDELTALAETIKLLNDDESLDLFKKTLGGKASFLQLTVAADTVRAKALQQLSQQESSPEHRFQLDLIVMALRGKKVGFEKVLEMIGNMTAALKEEQVSDNKKQDYCKAELRKGADKSKDLERLIASTETSIESGKEGLKQLQEEIKTTEESIKKLDKDVAEATEQRKAEHKEFTELIASNDAARKLLGLAKQRLNKFYNPGLAKEGAPALVEVSEHAPEAATTTLRPGRAAAPETFKGPYEKSAESHNVIAMLDTLAGDLEKENVEAETQEKEAQKSYEKATKDAAESRALSTKALTDKGSAKADVEGKLQELSSTKSATTKELFAQEELLTSLRTECDWLLKNFEVRKEARSDELESLARAKATLSGANLSLLQGRVHGFLARHGA